MSVSRNDLHLEALHIDELQSIWTDLWDQAGVGIRTDNKVGSMNRRCKPLVVSDASLQGATATFGVLQGVLLPWMANSSWTRDYLQPVLLTRGLSSAPGRK